MAGDEGRHDTDWGPLVVMGLAALLTVIRERQAAFSATGDSGRDDRREARWEARDARHAARAARHEARRRAREARRHGRWNAPRDENEGESSLKPVSTLVGLIAAFVGLGVLLTVLSGIAALGGGGAFLVACGLPAAMVAFVVWMVSKSKQAPKVATEHDPWTIDGTLGEAGQATQPGAATATSAPATIGAPEVVQGPTAPRQAPAPHDAPAHQAGKTAARPQPIPERPVRSPSEYRQRAASYRRKIQSLIKMRRPGPIAERMNGVLQRLKSWEERVGQLADRLTLYEKDDLIQRDVREVPGHIERLRRQLALEAEPEMQRQVQRTLAAYEEQQRQLVLLAKVMKRTRLNLDDTLAAMGTVYSQLQVLNAMDIDGPTASRIAGDIDREVERLNDLMAAMSDVYGSSSETPKAETPAAENDEDAGLSGRKSRLNDSAGS